MLAESDSIPVSQEGTGPGGFVPSIAASIWIILILGFAALHCKLSLTQFSPFGNPTVPFTYFDHPFHFYYAQLTAQVIQSGGSFWYYDPTFMAGYPKTLVFPTSSTVAELVCLVWPGNDALAYRWFVAATALLTPVVLALTARIVAGGWSEACCCFCLGVTWMWGWPFTYISWGMGPFIFTSALSICSALVLSRWLEAGGWAWLVVGWLVGTAATIAHPSSLVTTTLVFLPAYIAVFRSLAWTRHLAVWLLPGLVALAWSPWWLPAWLLRESFGSTSTGFLNPNVWERIRDELLVARFPAETGLLLAGLDAAWGLMGLGRSRCTALIAGVLGLFGLGYLAGGVPWLAFLQPGRYTQPLYALLVVLVAVGGWRLVACDPLKLRSGTGQTGGRGSAWRGVRLVIFCLVTAGLLFGLWLMGLGARQNMMNGSVLQAELPGSIQDLAKALVKNTDSSGRIFFEDRALTDYGDPFPGCNPSPLLPILAPGQYIGGPYLKTHLKNNFTQIGDGMFFTHDMRRLDEATFMRYANLYNAMWLVCWSNPMVGLAETSPARFELLGTYGPLRLYRINRAANWAVQGRAQVVATPNHLVVSDARPAHDGLLILSYHWTSALHADLPLTPVYLEDDPVPFIGVRNPPGNAWSVECGRW